MAALTRLNIWSERLRRRGIMVAPFSKESIPQTAESKSNDGYSGMRVEANVFVIIIIIIIN